MATLSRGQTFGATETITNTKLHALVDSGSVTGILNADCDSGMNLANSKLANIVDSGKVGGTSLFGLASIPSGAGVIPTEFGNTPIGAVIPWLKNLTGTPALPSNWVECNGQTISDASSPLDGTTLPDLNAGNLVLTGNSTSGGTSADINKAHTHSVDDHNHELIVNVTTGGRSSLETVDGGDVASTSYSNASGPTNTNSTGTATSYDVVYIMRIK